VRKRDPEYREGAGLEMLPRIPEAVLAGIRQITIGFHDLVYPETTPRESRFLTASLILKNHTGPAIADGSYFAAFTSFTVHFVTVTPFAPRLLTGSSVRSKSNSRTRAPLRPSSETWSDFGISFSVAAMCR